MFTMWIKHNYCYFFLLNSICEIKAHCFIKIKPVENNVKVKKTAQNPPVVYIQIHLL